MKELKGDLKRKDEPLQPEAGQIEKRLEEIDSEIGRDVRALGQGKLSSERLETEIAGLEADKSALRQPLDDVPRKLLWRRLGDFTDGCQFKRSPRGAITPVHGISLALVLAISRKPPI